MSATQPLISSSDAIVILVAAYIVVGTMMAGFWGRIFIEEPHKARMIMLSMVVWPIMLIFFVGYLLARGIERMGKNE